MSKIKVIEFFSGIGSQHKSFTNLEMEKEVVATVEWDVNAIISYDAINSDDGIDYSKDMSKEDILKELESYTFTTDGKKPCNKSKIKISKLRQLYNANKRSKNMGDITKIKNVPISNLWTYSFPCTDISIAGKQLGFEKGSGTRSGLLWEIERLLEISQSKNELPEYLLLENVKNLVGKEFKPLFEEWLCRLEEFGYNTYWKVTNAKDQGVPQNRQRVFAVSIRKDVDNCNFKFPDEFYNGLRLKDFLDTNVDDKYYINGEKSKKLLEQLDYKNREKKCVDMSVNTPKFRDVGNCITARYDCGISNQKSTGIGVVEEQKQITIPVLTPDRIEKRQNGRRFKEDGDPMFTITSQDKYGEQFGTGYAGNVWDQEYICPTLTTAQGGGREPHILEDFYTNRDIREYDDTCPTLRADRQGLKVVEDNNIKQLGTLNGHQSGHVYDSNGISVNICANGGGMGAKTGLYTVEDKQAIDNISDKYQFAKDKCQEYYDKHGKLPDMFQPYNQAEITDTAPTLTAACDRSCSSATVLLKQPDYRIRKLTPCETLKLMGFSDSDYEKLKSIGMSDSAIYKQSGNSIVTTCLMGIFGELFNIEYKDKIKDIRAFYNSLNT